MSTFRWLALIPAVALGLSGALVAPDRAARAQDSKAKDKGPDYEKKITEKNAGEQAVPKELLPRDEKEAQELVTRMERALADTRERFKKGAASALEVDLAIIVVHEVRLRLAILRQQYEDVVPNLKEMVTVRERILTRMEKQKAPFGETAANVDIGTRLLAESRLRLAKAQGDDKEALKQLEQIVVVARRELQRIESLATSRSATQQELEAARKVLDDARRRLADAKDK